LTIFLLSLIGIPMTGGFFGKFYVFSAALKSNLVWLTVIGLINSAIGAYYYLRIIVAMYMRQPQKKTPIAPVPFGVGLATAVCLVATFYLGSLPGRVLEQARLASQAVASPETSLPAPASSADLRTSPSHP
jgi:NADH-quinone oxidoreductase subunit N